MLSRVASFPLLDLVVCANLVGNSAATRSECTADQGTLTASHQTAHDCSARRGADHNLGSGVMLMIAGFLHFRRATMPAMRGRLLANNGKRDCKHRR